MGNSIIQLFKSKNILKVLILLPLVFSSCSENNSGVDPIDSGTTIAKIAGGLSQILFDLPPQDYHLSIDLNNYITNK